jgi:hypothetical protein
MAFTSGTNNPALELKVRPDDNAVGEHVEVVIVPLAGWAAR